jgi:GTP-binding protein
MNALTRAHFKEETYPFTTKGPQVAVLPLENYENLTLCELPSVYRTSHEGRGLGANFLKHLESAKMILYVIDPCSEFAESLKHGLEILREQVKIHSESFVNIPSAVAVNKMDLAECKEKAAKEKFKPGVPVFPISAQTGEGLDALRDFLGQAIKKEDFA